MSTIMDTRHGMRLNLEDPKPADITMEDIAWGLSGINRYGAQAPVSITIAEHCILVGSACREAAEFKKLSERECILWQLVGLLHDAHEAYIGDLIRPFKNTLNLFDGAVDALGTVTRNLDRVIAEFFGIDPLMFNDELVKDADVAVLHLEAEGWCGWNTSGWDPAKPFRLRDRYSRTYALVFENDPMPREQAFFAWQVQTLRCMWWLAHNELTTARPVIDAVHATATPDGGIAGMAPGPEREELEAALRKHCRLE